MQNGRHRPEALRSRYSILAHPLSFSPSHLFVLISSVHSFFPSTNSLNYIHVSFKCSPSQLHKLKP
jgi:hypothetical protein